VVVPQAEPGAAGVVTANKGKRKRSRKSQPPEVGAPATPKKTAPLSTLPIPVATPPQSQGPPLLPSPPQEKVPTPKASQWREAATPKPSQPLLARLPSSSPEEYSSPSESEKEDELTRKMRRRSFRRSPGSEDLVPLGDDDASDLASVLGPTDADSPPFVPQPLPLVKTTEDAESAATHDSPSPAHEGVVTPPASASAFPVIDQEPPADNVDDDIESVQTEVPAPTAESAESVQTARFDDELPIRERFEDVEAVGSSGVPHNSGAVAYFNALSPVDEACNTSSRAASESLNAEGSAVSSEAAGSTPSKNDVPGTPLQPSSTGPIPPSTSPKDHGRPPAMPSQPTPTPKSRSRKTLAVEIPAIPSMTQVIRSPSPCPEECFTVAGRSSLQSTKVSCAGQSMRRDSQLTYTRFYVREVDER
jgi:hypothetical protein